MHLAFLSTLLASAQATSLWPLPQSVVFGPASRTLPPDFAFTTSSTSPSLHAAFARTLATMRVAVPPVLPYDGPSTGVLSSVQVTLASNDEDLSFNVSEAYSLDVSGAAGTLEADTLYGALRGLETLSQLAEYVPASGSVIVRVARIVDAPRFPHRGALVDTSRHFIPVGTLLAFVDAMAYNKLNVLHWHGVDDQSFPWQSVTFPALSARGAWGGLPSHTYSPEAVQQVIAYARARGVRVMVEFDTPGHTTSWGLGQPNFTTPCYFPNGSLTGTTGPVNPTLDSTYAFLAALYAEVAATFPDTYMHIGGDEVSFACWASNPSINQWMAANGFAPGDYAGLESYYVQKNLQLVAAAGKRAVGWQELFDNHLKLAAGTVVNVWKYHNSPSACPPPKPGAPTWQSEMANVTAAGFLALLSSPWYLNVVTYGSADIWQCVFFLLRWYAARGRPPKGRPPPPFPPGFMPRTRTTSRARPRKKPSSLGGSCPCGGSGLTPPTCSRAPGRAAPRWRSACGPPPR